MPESAPDHLAEPHSDRMNSGDFGFQTDRVAPAPTRKSNVTLSIAEGMAAELPPPDPNESLGMRPGADAALSAPTVADAVPDLRPGLLIVLESD
jgi:hypothetical protein